MKKIDAHFHVNFSGFDADKIIRYLDDHNIDTCWLLSWEQLAPPIPSLYQNLSVEDVINAYTKYPERIIPFYAPDPKSSTVREDLKKYLVLGIKGCGELKVTYKWEDNLIEKYLKIVSEFNIPLLFHMEAPRMHYVRKGNSAFEKAFAELMTGALNGRTKYYISKITEKTSLFSKRIRNNSEFFPGYLYDFDFLEKRLTQFPDLVFIGHGPHFWNNISSTTSPKYFHQRGRIEHFGVIDRLLEEYDNLYCDISGKSGFNALSRDTKQAKVFLEKHAAKILFGTDNANYNLESFIRSFKLPSEKLNKIFYRNAEGILQ